MSASFEEVQAVVSTLILLPAMVALIVFALRDGRVADEEHWDPRRDPERDWWGGEERA